VIVNLEFLRPSSDRQKYVKECKHHNSFYYDGRKRSGSIKEISLPPETL